MSIIPIRSEASSRGARMLRTALGSEIAAWLEDAAVIEVMLNPDDRLWIDRLGDGIADTGRVMPPADGERIIRLVAHHVGVEVHAKAPRVSAELPECGERFEGLLPSVVAAPSFAIRKPAAAVFTLANYVTAGIMDQWQAEALVAAVANRKNILVAGGTSTGKTTLTNALLAEVAKTDDRVVLIEDKGRVMLLASIRSIRLLSSEELEVFLVHEGQIAPLASHLHRHGMQDNVVEQRCGSLDSGRLQRGYRLHDGDRPGTEVSHELLRALLPAMAEAGQDFAFNALLERNDCPEHARRGPRRFHVSVKEEDRPFAPAPGAHFQNSPSLLIYGLEYVSCFSQPSRLPM